MKFEETEQFLNALPTLKEDEDFCFSCDSSIECFNSCCADLNLVLTPYDVLKLRQALNSQSRSFLERYTQVAMSPNTGFPEVSLKMCENNNRSCPFVSANGCRVYEYRPSACRAYPLGRGAFLNCDGQISEKFVLLREDHCLGFRSETSWTPKSWQENQVLEPYNRSNDLYLRLESNWRRKGTVLNREQFAISILALYRPDVFREFIQAKGLLDLTSLAESKKKDILQNEAECLAFAMRWFESELRKSSL